MRRLGNRAATCTVRARVCAVGLLLVGLSATARGAGSSTTLPVILEWHAPPGCPSSDEVESAVRRFMPQAPRVSAGMRAVRIDVVREDEATWRATLTWNDERADDDGPAARRRSFTAESCRAVADASALVLALTLQTAAASGGENDAATARSPPSPPERNDERERTRAASIAPPPRIGSAGVWLVGDAGDLPSPRAGVGVSVRAGLGHQGRSVHLGGSLAIFLPGSTESGPAGGRFLLATASAEGCFEPAIGPVHAGGCGVAEGALLEGRGLGQTESSTSKVGEWLLLELRASGEAPVSSGWSVRAELGPAIGVGRPTFQASGPSSQGTFVFRPGLIVGRAALGAGEPTPTSGGRP